MNFLSSCELCKTSNPSKRLQQAAVAESSPHPSQVRADMSALSAGLRIHSSRASQCRWDKVCTLSAHQPGKNYLPVTLLLTIQLQRSEIYKLESWDSQQSTRDPAHMSCTVQVVTTSTTRTNPRTSQQSEIPHHSEIASQIICTPTNIELTTYLTPQRTFNSGLALHCHTQLTSSICRWKPQHRCRADKGHNRMHHPAINTEKQANLSTG
eukprot:3653612-Amphidinium_carterae.1